MVEAISDQIKRKKDEVEEVIDNLPELEAQVSSFRLDFSFFSIYI